MLDEFYIKSEKPVISFEVYPPKNDENLEKTKTLIEELKKLKEFNPALISITYGAGGSGRENTIELAKLIKDELKIPPMPHCTCICSKKEFLDNYLNQIQQIGARCVLALRGDEPKDIDVCYKDFLYANDLIKYIKENTSLSIAAAGYPEKHLEAESFEKDLIALKNKIDCGASVIYTQLFFDNTHFYRFLGALDKLGVNVPVIPGILPITSFNQLGKMAKMCGASVSSAMYERFEKYKDSEEDTLKAGIEFASIQTNELLNYGVKGLHLYTLDRADSCYEILKGVL